MKKLCLISLTLLLVASLLVACTTTPNKNQSTQSTQSTQSSQTKAEMTQDELITAAKAEGKLVVYGVHSYLEKAAAAFSQKYGIKVEWTLLGETELIDKAAGESKAKVSGGADLIFCQDGARIQSELVAPGYVYKWSSDRLGALTGNKDMTLSVFEYSCKGFIYNNEKTGSTQYLTNIWQVADPKNKGLFSMKDPYAEGVNFNFFTMITSDENAKKVAEAYKAYYGKDIQLTTKNAGYEWIKAVYKNGVVLGTSDTKISEAVGAKGQASTWTGLFSVQRFATASEKNLALAMNTKMAPFVGFYYPIRSVITSNAKNTNAAKLFVEYMLGEEGWSFWSKNVGDYNANTKLPHAGDISFDQWKSVAVGEDMDFVYKNRANVEDFITSLK